MGLNCQRWFFVLRQETFLKILTDQMNRAFEVAMNKCKIIYDNLFTLSR